MATAILENNRIEYEGVGYYTDTTYPASIDTNDDEYYAGTNRFATPITDPGWSNPPRFLTVVDTDVPVVVMLDVIGALGLTCKLRWWSGGMLALESETQDSSVIHSGTSWSVAVNGTETYLAYYGGSYKIHRFSGPVLSASSASYHDALFIGVSENYLFAVQYTTSASDTTTVWKFDRVTLTLVDTFIETADGREAVIYVQDDSVFYTLSMLGHVYKWVDGVVVSDLGARLQVRSSTTNGVWFRVFSDSPFYGVSVSRGSVGTLSDVNVYVGHEVVPSAVAKLRDIVTSECGLAGISASDIDLTGLTDSDVRGFRIANAGSIRSSLEMLQAAFPFDVAPSGYKLRFVSRGGATLATIPEADLGAVAGGDSLPVLLPVSREMDTQIPYKVSVRYLDPAREYDIGEQYASRPDTASVSERTVELSLVMTGDEAAQAADILNQKDWLERVSFGPFSLPPTYRAIEPPDVVTVEHRGQSHTIRLTRAEFLPDGRIECSGVYSAAQSYTSSATTQESLTVGQSLVPLLGSTAGYLLDIPRIRAEQDVIGMPFGLLGRASGWPGGVLLRSDDAGTTWQSVGAINTRAGVFTAGGTLPAHHGYSPDTSALTLTPLTPGITLSSVTEDQFYSQTNLAAWGTDGRWEIVAFRAVTDNTGTWTLRDFLRGLYGTAQFSGLHVTGDLFILLDTASIGFFGLPTNALGASRLYRAVTTGAAISSAPDVVDTYDGIALKPLPPVDVCGDRNRTSNDWTVSAVRRSRTPVEVFSGSPVPLGENTENYRFTIYDDAFVAIKRQKTTATGSVTYTSAEQTTDFAAAKNALNIGVEQWSDSVGWGYETRLTINQASGYIVGGYAGAVLAKTPVAYFKLDDAATPAVDSSTSANNGTVSGTVTFRKTGLLTGAIGYCYGIAGGYVNVPHLAGMNGAFSVLLRLKVTTAPGAGAYSAIFHKGDEASGGNQGYMLTLDTNLKLYAAWFNGSWRSQLGATSLLAVNENAHLAFTYDGATTVKAYKNGVLADTLTLSAAFVNSASSLKLFREYNGGSLLSPLTADADEFSWHSGVLADAEIAAIYGES